MSVQKKPRAKAGTRLDQVMQYIRKEMMNDELLFTADHARTAGQQFGISEIDVYNVLTALEKKGKITREKKGPGKGTVVRFAKSDGVPANPKPATDGKSDVTISDVLLNLDREIGKHRADIFFLEGEIARHNEEIKRKDSLRAEIARLGGKS